MFKSILRLSARNALRNRVRTGLTAAMVVAGVALLVVGMSWLDGVLGQAYRLGTDMAGHVRLATPGYADSETLMPLYENIEDTGPVIAAVKQLPGVEAIYPRITTGVTVTATEEIGEFFALAVGAPEGYFRQRLAGDKNLHRGTWFSGDQGELILGCKVVEQIQANVGEDVVLLGLTQDGAMSPIKGTLVGITCGPNPVYNRQIWVPLEKMRWLADIERGATEILVFGKHYHNASTLAAAIAAAPIAQSNIVVQPWTSREPWRSLIEQMSGIRNFILLFVLILTSLGIWNTMMMSVLERTHEIGVLRAMGLGRLGTIGLFVVEALTISILGGGLGVSLGAIPAWLLEKYGIHLGEKIVSQMADTMPMSETMYGDLTVEAVATGFVMGLVMALMGSFVPALRAASIQPVTAMRTGR